MKPVDLLCQELETLEQEESLANIDNPKIQKIIEEFKNYESTLFSFNTEVA